MADHDPIAQIYQKIEREKVLINAAQNMRGASNPIVQASLDAQVKEGQRNIQYLEQKMKELELRHSGRGSEDAQGGDPRSNNRDNGAGGPSGGYSGSGMMPPRPPYGSNASGSMPKGRPNYSKLGKSAARPGEAHTDSSEDLIKADTQYLSPRFQLMLSQLTFKLSVEKQYKDGIEKLVKLYGDDGDRKSKSDAEARRVESNQKIQLLRQALKRYEDLHVDMDSSDDIQDGKSAFFRSTCPPLIHGQTIVSTRHSCESH